MLPWFEPSEQHSSSDERKFCKFLIFRLIIIENCVNYTHFIPLVFPANLIQVSHFIKRVSGRNTTPSHPTLITFFFVILNHQPFASNTKIYLFLVFVPSSNIMECCLESSSKISTRFLLFLFLLWKPLEPVRFDVLFHVISLYKSPARIIWSKHSKY